MHESTHFIIGYKEESREHNYRLRTRVLELQKEKPDQIPFKALGLAEGERVTRMTRLRWLEGQYNDKPIMYTTVYVPVPTIRIASTGYTQNGMAVEYSESYYPASRSSFKIEINR